MLKEIVGVYRQTKPTILKDEKGKLLLNNEDISSIRETYIGSIFGDSRSTLLVEIGEINEHVLHILPGSWKTIECTKIRKASVPNGVKKLYEE